MMMMSSAVLMIVFLILGLILWYLHVIAAHLARIRKTLEPTRAFPVVVPTRAASASADEPPEADAGAPGTPHDETEREVD